MSPLYVFGRKQDLAFEREFYLIPRDTYPPGMGAVCESLKPAGTGPS